MGDWEAEARRAGWLPVEAVKTLRHELGQALGGMPSEEGFLEALDTLTGKPGEVTDSADLDRIEIGMSLQDGFESLRDSLNAALSLLPPEPGHPAPPGETTVHILFGGLPLCEFTTKPPRDWKVTEKWAHTPEELKRLRGSEKACMGCLKTAAENAERKSK